MGVGHGDERASPRAAATRFSGNAGYAYQPFDWNGNNVANCSDVRHLQPAAPRGRRPPPRSISSTARSAGRSARLAVVLRLAAPRGVGSGDQPHLRRGGTHPGVLPRHRALRQRQRELAAVREDQRQGGGEPRVQRLLPARPAAARRATASTTTSQIQAQSTGGSLFGGKLTSVFCDRLTDDVHRLVQQQGRQRHRHVRGAGPAGPQIIIHREANLHGRTSPPASGRILEGGNLQNYAYQPASQMMFRADLTYFRDGWAGDHEFQTGIFAAPRSTYDQQTQYVNDGSCSRSSGCATSTTRPRARCRSIAATVTGGAFDPRGGGSQHRLLRSGQLAADRRG